MAVVALFPTGKMEHQVLAASLGRIFPEHVFECRPAEGALAGFTSCDVSAYSVPTATRVPSVLENLVSNLVNAILPKTRREPASYDFAVLIDDLELANQEQPGKVLEVFRESVLSYFQKLRATPSTDPNYLARVKWQEAEVQKRCSFHLFRPMTEAYFFGDSEALKRASIKRTPLLPDGVDLELFKTLDPDYLRLPNKSDRPNWSHDLLKDSPDRERHPKSYMQFLCDPDLTSKKARYREVVEGVEALKKLCWETIIGHQSKCPFLTALLDDLSQALQSDLPFLDSANADDRVQVNSSKRVLRNL